MGIPVSLILIAVGLILALAVHPTSSAVDVNAVGWIVFGVGAFGLLLTIALWDSWAGRRLWDHRDPGHAYRRPPARRRTVVEEDDGPPPRY